MEFQHTSVLWKETVDGLLVRPGKIYLDGTLGGAGHSEEILRRLNGSGKLIGIDQDEEALTFAAERLKPFGSGVSLHHTNYENFEEVLAAEKCPLVDGILLDLGVSSHQLDDGERGFSYRFDAPLDMRMDLRSELTARTIVNEYTETELFHIIRDYGEDPFAKNIAKHIVAARASQPVETTFQLVEIIKGAIPARVREKKGHPAKQTFQALRIEVNRELFVLSASLEKMIDHLTPGGRMAVITFHSLEDRLVKEAFRKAENPCTCPPSFPVCVCGKISKGRIITRKAITAAPEEMEKNPRSRSAHLRIFEKA